MPLCETLHLLGEAGGFGFAHGYFTPGSKVLHPGLRSGHSSGVDIPGFSLA